MLPLHSPILSVFHSIPFHVIRTMYCIVLAVIVARFWWLERVACHERTKVLVLLRCCRRRNERILGSGSAVADRRRGTSETNGRAAVP